MAWSIAFFPFSWAMGKWEKEHKTLWSLGPLRFVVHHTTGSWKG